jgi:hypothetical protein
VAGVIRAKRWGGNGRRPESGPRCRTNGCFSGLGSRPDGQPDLDRASADAPRKWAVDRATLTALRQGRARHAVSPMPS